MKGISTELKVGLFAIVVLAVLSYMTFKVGGLDFVKREGYIVYIYFKNVAGLDERTKVKIAGVDAGIIEKIELKDGKAKLMVRINKDIILYSDASASVKAVGLLGDKYLEIKPGLKTPVLTDGQTLERVFEVVDIDDLARNLTAVSENINILAQSLNETLGTEESKEALRESIQNIRTITANLNQTITVNDRKLRDALDNITDLTASISNVVEENRDNLSTAMSNMRDFSKTLKDDTPTLIANLNKAAGDLRAVVEENRPKISSTMDSLNSITAKIDKGEGTLGKLVKDERLYENVSKAAEGVERTISAVERFRTFLTFQADYLTEPQDGKGYFSVTLQPKPDKYYILGIVSDPLGRVRTKETITTTDTGTKRVKEEKIEQKIEFTAQFAKRFGDIAFRLGMTENTFGAGADYFFLGDRGRITADIWDFSNDEEDSENPHLRVGLDYFLFKNIFVSAGADNVLNKRWRGVYAGGGLRFEDEDLKYLFGTLPRISTQ
ncbi:MAG: MlaD family protein [Nitrospirota bacterium]